MAQVEGQILSVSSLWAYAENFLEIRQDLAEIKGLKLIWPITCSGGHPSKDWYEQIYVFEIKLISLKGTDRKLLEVNKGLHILPQHFYSHRL